MRRTLAVWADKHFPRIVVMALVVFMLLIGRPIVHRLVPAPTRSLKAASRIGTLKSGTDVAAIANRRLPAGTLQSESAPKVRLAESYGKLPLSFEINQGQTDAKVKFLSRGRGYTLFLTEDEAVLALRGESQKSKVKGQKAKVEERYLRLPASFIHPFDWTTDNGPRATDEFFAPLIQNPKSQIRNSPVPSPQSLAPALLRMKLVDANPQAKVTGLDPLPGKTNYFIGNDPKKWRTNVSNYAKVKYQGIYPGIDLVYYGNQRQLEYDFVVAPGADPRLITLNIDGAKKMEIDAQGDLVLRADAGDIRLHKPLAYQPTTDHGARTRDRAGNSPFTIQNSQFVDGRFLLLASNRIGFEVSSYDKTKPLIIDPVLSYSTYLGGSDSDGGSAIAVDSAGNAYVTGWTISADFPTANPLQASYAGGDYDAFVTKLNAAGSALVYSTYLGGSGWDRGLGIAVDLAGNAYVTGETNSADFPTANPLQASYAGGTCGGSGVPLYPCRDAFVTKLNAAGSALVYSTYLGGSLDDWGTGIAVDSTGNAYVTGATISTDFPTANPLQVSYAIDADAFVAKLNAAGAALVYSTYLGGSDVDWGDGIAVDSAGNAYVTGETYSTDFPTANPLQPANTAYWDAFVTKLNAAGSALVYSTYLGGSSGDGGAGIAVDSAGNAYVTGWTMSADFPTVNPIQAAYGGGGSDTFVTEVNAAGSALVYSTYLGGSGYYYGDQGNAIAVDSAGNAYVTGETDSTDFPTANPLQSTLAGYWDAFVTKLNPAGSALVYSTYLGGNYPDFGYGIALDSVGNAYVTGAIGPNFPTANPIQGGFAGYSDAFVAKVSPADAPGVGLSPNSLTFGSQFLGTPSAAQTVTLHNWGSASLTITDISTSGDFAQSNDCDGGVAGGGAFCTISVTFSPTATGTRTGAVSITDNAAGSPHAVNLSGTGVAPAVTLNPPGLDFGAWPVSSPSSSELVTLTNNGDAELTIASIGKSGGNIGDFAYSHNCPLSPSTLGAGGSCVITVTFTPTAGGPRKSSLRIASDAAGSPHRAILTGIGSALSLAPSSWNFGSQQVGTTSPGKAITLTNLGSTAVHVWNSAVTGTDSGDFSRVSSCPVPPATLAGSSSCTISVQFTPAGIGARTASLMISHDAGGSPAAVSLTGNGTAAGAGGMAPGRKAPGGQPSSGKAGPVRRAAPRAGAGRKGSPQEGIETR